ncbi:type I secretion system permease/ATPase [Sphingomicrobium astaxanthinifaciens]|uniref:type I secretion system permease/ATPase n=1 Tax=Sphingomicrobium astaxanthinifaciens TaxID=1227949 RepID=UPI001FCB1A83|nr:type I secretion system permease/ATPase [Sphingomicrobium astaxanthinifaciens]MCJ7420204.1 type I secretion system permease/ATPase [Sphingomicrobium astaxanthinifaciens]
MRLERLAGAPLAAPAGAGLRETLRAGRRYWQYAALFSAAFNLLFLVPMLYLLQVYDRVVPTRGALTLAFLTIVLVLALGTMAVLDYARGRILVRASARLDRDLAAPLLRSAIETRSDRDGGSRRLLREFDTLRQALSGPAMLALFDAPWTPLYILVCFLIHPAVGALATFGALVLVLLAWRNDRRTRAPLERANAAAAATYASQDQSLLQRGTVRALGMREAMVDRHLEERVAMLGEQSRASMEGSGTTAFAKFLRLLLQSLALGLGAWLAINDQVTPGAIFASMFLVGRALMPIDRLVGSWKQLVAARDAYHLIDRSLVAAGAPLVHTALPDPVGRLALEKITVYASGGAEERPILDKVGFKLGAGEAVALIGPSGAGKTTLLSVVAGALEPDEGTVRFDGAERADWDSEQLARFIGFMPQHPTLFAGSVRDNIARFSSRQGAAEIDAKVVAAAQKAGAHELILALPGGYDHALGLGGSGLSMGQAQRIALARALYDDPRYLLLDEPNAHLDAEGDLQLIEALDAAKSAGTTLLIAVHRLSVLPVVDRIILLRAGRVELDGPQEEVLARIGKPRARVQRHPVRAEEVG